MDTHARIQDPRRCRWDIVICVTDWSLPGVYLRTEKKPSFSYPSAHKITPDPGEELYARSTYSSPPPRPLPRCCDHRNSPRDAISEAGEEPGRDDEKREERKIICGLNSRMRLAASIYIACRTGWSHEGEEMWFQPRLLLGRRTWCVGMNYPVGTRERARERQRGLFIVDVYT